MKFVKVFLPIAFVSVIGVSADSLNVSASSWHKGVPKIIRNKTYLMGKTKGNQFMGYVGYTFKKSNIYLAHSMDGGHLSKHLKYKKTGYKSYYIKGYDLDTKDRLKVKIISSKKVYIADLDNSLYRKYVPYNYYGKNFPSIH